MQEGSGSWQGIARKGGGFRVSPGEFEEGLESTSIIRHTALNPIHAIKDKASLKIRRKTVGWDDDNASQLARYQGATSSRPFIPGWNRHTYVTLPARLKIVRPVA
ncbi:MAG: hypothetical protein M3Z96_01200, partial [Pseudomonadota bacterium]|nr:hypothetical protein [Pseudomonadota bacterium]